MFHMTFSLLEEQVIKAIGLKGYARMKELKEEETFQETPYNQLYEAVKELGNKEILQREVIRIGGSGKYAFNVFEFTQKGENAVQQLLNRLPVVSEKQVLLQQHGDLEIGYIFKDCAPLLQEKEIVLTKGEKHYTITLDDKTYPLFIDTKRHGERRPTNEEYLEVFDTLYAQSPIFFYLSTSYITSSFLILDQIEAWIKARNILNQKEQKPFQFYTSFTGRILDGNGDTWNSLIDLWNDGIERWSKMPSIYKSTP